MNFKILNSTDGFFQGSEVSKVENLFETPLAFVEPIITNKKIVRAIITFNEASVEALKLRNVKQLYFGFIGEGFFEEVFFKTEKTDEGGIPFYLLNDSHKIIVNDSDLSTTLFDYIKKRSSYFKIIFDMDDAGIEGYTFEFIKEKTSHSEIFPVHYAEC